MADYVRPVWTSLSGSTEPNRLGRFDDVIAVTGTLICTGSAWGVGAVIVPTGATGDMSGSTGGINIADLVGIGVVEFAPKVINVSTGTVYALKKNNAVI